jgi:hypothetical protein
MNVFMLSVANKPIMLSVIMLSVIMLNVVAPRMSVPGRPFQPSLLFAVNSRAYLRPLG